MSIEARCFVRLGANEKAQAEELNKRAAQALARSEKGLPGERDDVIRFEMLCTGIERLAAEARLNGAKSVVVTESKPDISSVPLVLEPRDIPSGAPAEVSSWVKSDSAVVELRLPFLAGMARKARKKGSLAPVANPWNAEGPARQAQIERLRSQLDAVLAGEPGAAVRPSGVPNTVLTETLREYVARSGPKEAIEAPVHYRDGSTAEPFPLNSLRLRDTSPQGRRVLRFVLLSIRHMDADFAVDGAWFRNALISLPRPAAITDAVATDQTTLQLDRLCSRGPVEIRVYQTGLDSAIIGFYRAVAQRLIRDPKSLTVVPYFHREGKGGANDFYRTGKPWAV